ncbi:DNA ligase 1-like [Anomalospiza imberbis]|uniref:DNA ligase 1-like n=1 Tax=Anomalospiza imberbis TaxID=187417 RepID=UPI00358F9512
MNARRVSGSRKGKMWVMANIFSHRKAEVLDTPDTSGSSKGEEWGIPNASGSSREVWCTSNISGSRGTESWHTCNVSGNRRRKVLERQCEDTDPRKTTAEGSRHTSDTSQHPSAYGDQPSDMKKMFEIMKEMDNKKTKEVFEMVKEMDNKKTKEMFEMVKEMDNKKTKEMFEMVKEMDNKKTKEMFEMVKEMDNKKTKETFEMVKEMDNKKTKEMFEMVKEMDNKKTKETFEMMKEMHSKNTKEIFEMMKNMDKKIITLADTVQYLLNLLDSHNRALPERLIQILCKEKGENETLKEKTKKLEERIQELLAKAMAMHQHSEDINDPSRLSAVLERYEMLRLQEWEKVRSSMPYCWTYEEGSRAIRKVFDACEKDIQQRADHILKVLDIPPSNKVNIPLTKVFYVSVKGL